MSTLSPSRTERNSAVELLRVGAMLMIVLSHACVHSGFEIDAAPVTFNSLFLRWGMLGNLGVDIFVLISGYYLCRKKWSSRSLIRLLLQIWFYSLVLFFICSYVFYIEYPRDSLLQALFPILFQEYWFCTAYVLLYLLSPFINRLLEALEAETLEKLLVLMFLLWGVVPILTQKDLYGGILAEFVFLYLLGSYIRLHPGRFPGTSSGSRKLAIGSLTLLFLLTVPGSWLQETFCLAKNPALPLYSRGSPLVIGCALGLLSAAVSARPFSRRFINLLGSCTFGVYLIHDNPAVRFLLWHRLVKHAEHFDSPLLCIRILLSVAAVYAVCTAAEYLRLRFLEKPLLRITEKLFRFLPPFRKL